MSKIIGVTVGTPTSPAKMQKELQPVQTVNGISPDENGNVNVEVDVDGEVLLKEQTIDGFTPGVNDDTLYVNAITVDFSFTEGKSYKVKWDGAVHTCTATELSGAISIGNPFLIGEGEDSGEPFVIGITSDGIMLFNANSEKPSHRVAIYANDTAATSLPTVTEDDNGKFLRVVDGAWAAAKSEGSGTVSTQRIVILDETNYTGFALSEAYGVYAYGFSPCPFALVIGETYTVEWDGVSYTCTAVDASALMPGFVALGNFSAFTGGASTGEPFVLGYAEVGISGQPEINFIALDTQTEHAVAIYQEDAIATESFVKTYVEQYISEALGGDY